MKAMNEFTASRMKITENFLMTLSEVFTATEFNYAREEYAQKVSEPYCGKYNNKLTKLTPHSLKGLRDDGIIIIDHTEPCTYIEEILEYEVRSNSGKIEFKGTWRQCRDYCYEKYPEMSIHYTGGMIKVVHEAERHYYRIDFSALRQHIKDCFYSL